MPGTVKRSDPSSTVFLKEVVSANSPSSLICKHCVRVSSGYREPGTTEQAARNDLKRKKMPVPHTCGAAAADGRGAPLLRLDLMLTLVCQ